MKRLFILIGLLLVLVLPQTSVGRNQRRVALVIGNGAYASSPLKNPPNDARDMAAKLGQLGFQVITLTDADNRRMESAVRDFGRKLRKGGVGLFFYAGHGLQVGGVNYLVPTNARIEKESDVKFECLDANRVLAEMDEARNGLNIMILDACRDNPYARAFRSAHRGLAQMDAPTGTFIAFSTAPGSVASDGSGRNGLFTGALLKHMDSAGLEIEKVMKLIRNDVIEATGNLQVPWQSSSLTGDFFFAPEPAAKAGAVKPVAPPPTPAAPGEVPDLDPVIEQREQAEKKWADWQKRMDSEYARVDGYDRSDALKPSEKVNAWAAFLEAFADENPYSTKDDDLKSKAAARLTYWKNQPDSAPPKPEEKPKTVASVAPSVTAAPTPQAAMRTSPMNETLRQAIEYYSGLGGKVDYKKAHTLFIEAARKGDPYSVMWLARMHFNGRGDFDKDRSQAVRLAGPVLPAILAAAQRGELEAEFLMASAYNDGMVVEKDEKLAAEMYEQAAGKGHFIAMNNLGDVYEDGEGVDQDYEKAAVWYKKAAESGVIWSMNELGLMYKNGKGVKEDYQQALHWFQKGADRGYHHAIANLGVLYASGKGVTEDDHKAVTLYKQAAALGNAFSMNKLGICYEEGEGVRQDYQEAREWYLKAAENGNSWGMKNLGDLYYRGLGVQPDRDAGFQWYLKAAKAGNDSASKIVRSKGYDPKTGEKMQGPCFISTADPPADGRPAKPGPWFTENAPSTK